MPIGANRPCTFPGCRGLAVEFGRCLEHRRKDDRASAAGRGYDRRWRKIRWTFLCEHPFCDVCGELAVDVHHKRTLREGGTHDLGNLQALCHACHSRLTNECQ